MRLRLIKELFKKLQKGPFKLLVALVATVQQTVKYRSPVYISIDKQGDWHNRRRDVTIVSTELNVAPWNEIQAAVKDLWCYDYVLKSGETVVDVGAGIGDDVVALSKLVGKNGHVIALEAHPHTFRCLLKTIAANQLENVTALNLAVTDQEGEVSISNDENFLSNSILSGLGGMMVKARTLDNILDEMGVMHVDLVKMNIEGAETNALRGMTKTLRVLPHIVVSCHDFIADNHGGDPVLRTYDDVNRILDAAGYTMCKRREASSEAQEYYMLAGLGYYVYGEKSDAVDIQVNVGAMGSRHLAGEKMKIVHPQP
jgi:FkbM family methyltransferase